METTPKIEVFVSPDNNELIIREGKALPLQEPRVVTIGGILSAPSDYLLQRVGLLDAKACHLLVDREAMSLTLKVNEADHYITTVKGSLTVHPLFKLFAINQERFISHQDMAKLFKMNRAAFEGRAEAMRLVTLLQNFRATVNKQVEKLVDNQGNKTDLMRQVVESNLPHSFFLHIPLFKGTPKTLIEVEVYINADDLTCTLISPHASELVADALDREIDAVLLTIRETCPGLLIIEQ